MKKCITVIMLLLCLGYGYSEKYYRKNEITFEHDEDFWIGAGWKNVHSSLQLKSEKTKVCHYDNYYDYEKRKYTLYVEKGASLVRGSFVLKEDFIPGGGISVPFPQVSGTDDNTIFMNLTLNRLMNVLMYRINDLPESNQLYFVNSKTNVKLNLMGPESTREYTQIELDIIPDDDYPYIEINNKKLSTLYDGEIPDIIYFNKNSETINYEIKDDTSGIVVCKRITNDYILSIPGGFFTEGIALDLSELFGSSVFSYNGVLIGDDTYKLIIEDLVGHRIKQTIVVDRTEPEITAYTDSVLKMEFSGSNWTNQDLYVSYDDRCSGIATINGIKHSDLEVNEESYTETGIYNLSATDKAGNTAVKTIKIDKILPELKTSLEYKTEFDEKQNNYKSQIVLNIEDIKDEHSGIAGISVTPVLNGVEEEKKSVNIGNEKGLNIINNKSFTYDIPDRNIDNYIKFEVTVIDEAGNPQTVPLGGEQGYFVPAAIHTNYNELIGEEKNKVKVNFYKGKYNGITSPKCDKGNYRSIRFKRHFSLINSKNPSLAEEITEASFGQTSSYWFNTSAKGIWETLTRETGGLTITTSGNESYYTDTAIENTGFTHKNISYDCIYEYTNPVNSAETITETICNDTIIKLTNNKGRYSIRVKGEDNTYLVIDDKGDIKEGSTETFKMPDTGVVELAIKVEDSDIEEYQVLVQGYAELVSENGKFKLQETDTDPVGTEGIITGCGESEVRNDNKNVFISRDKEMDGNWVKIGEYALQYNVTTVLAVKLTEGYSGNQEQWTDKTVRLYVQSPSVLGGKARLIVGDAGSYNADGITARPNQPIKMEIVPAEGGQAFTDLFWDFGNGKTSKENDYGNYQKNSNSSFENIRYDQSPERTGALSEYTLKIKAGTDEAEFKVNIIDTQFGKLYGDEVWRGEHIIKKEIIVTDNKTLQIGDTAHSEYDSDIKCLCVGKINPENKGGITVEQGGELILDEGEAKTIRFVQAGFKDDKYVEAAEEEKSWQNKWRGIVVKGNLSGDSLNLFDADCGLTVFPGVSIELSDSIKMENCGNGILMNGESLKAKEIKLNKCSGYGLKLNSTLECENLFVNNSGRGVVLTENGSLTADNLEIKDSITGIHLLGGNLEIGSGRISGCSEYGIKTDKDGSYNYESVIVEDNERNIYINGLIR